MRLQADYASWKHAIGAGCYPWYIQIGRTSYKSMQPICIDIPGMARSVDCEAEIGPWVDDPANLNGITIREVYDRFGSEMRGLSEFLVFAAHFTGNGGSPVLIVWKENVGMNGQFWYACVDEHNVFGTGLTVMQVDAEMRIRSECQPLLKPKSP